MPIKRVLTAFADKRFDARLQDWVEDILGDDIPIRHAETCEDVLNRFAKSAPDLLILDLALPTDRKSPRDKTAITGLKFIETAHAQGLIRDNNTSVIVIDQFDAGAPIERRILDLDFATPFAYARMHGYEVFDALDQLLNDLSARRQPDGIVEPAPMTEKPVLTVEVSLEKEKQRKVELRLSNQLGTPFYDAISPAEYEEMLHLSDMLQPTRAPNPTTRDWKESASFIGRRIYASIFGGKPQREIEEWRKRLKLTDEDLRIRFRIPSDKHSILFETLTANPDSEFQIVHTPIARQLEIGPDEHRPGPRLREAQTLNILVIDASEVDNKRYDKAGDPDFSDWVRRVAKDKNTEPRFRSLKNGKGEVEMFRELKQAAERNAPWQVLPELPPYGLRADIREIRILDPVELGCKTPQEFGQKITETLANRGRDGKDWHIIHYVGHSVAAIAESSKSGYFILPGGDTFAAISVEHALAELPVAGTRFVYFSSCQFGSAQVALATARRRVPATLGFRWNVRDKSALTFSRHFYHALFCSRLTVDEAVRDARRKTKFDTQSDDPTWVSAVFTCYGERWHGGYGERLCTRDVPAAE